MGILAYGEVSIVDISDVGKLQSYITSNQPSIVVYDPNSSDSYNPNWATNKLVLTPVIFFNGEQLGLTETGVSITWQRQAGSGDISTLITGETVKDGTLEVTKNVLSEISSGLITYVCSISYTDPDTAIEVSTKSQMSFSLVKNASELKDCKITGEQTFTYNGEGTLTSASSIVLTAILTNTSISQWQYKKPDGTYDVYPGSSNLTTLTVNATDNVFINDVAVIKAVTIDSTVFDLHQIVKIKDGAAGNNTYTCILSNDSQSVPADSSGNLFESSLNGCSTVITVYEGATDDTSNWTITATPSVGVTGLYNETTKEYTVTGLTVDAGHVEFIATRSGYATITKRFSVIKERSGADGASAVIYQLKPNVSVIKLDSSDNFTPTAVVFSAYKREGNAVESTVYEGRFKIYETVDGNETLKYTSGSDESSVIYTPSSTFVTLIKAELYVSGGTTTLLDAQTLNIVSDGKNGEAGASGSDALNVVIGNMAEVIPCDANGNVLETKDIIIPYSCYLGTTRVAGTAVLGTLPSGMTSKITSATAAAEGIITLTVASGAILSTASSGDITITVTSEKLTSTHKFTWTKSLQASDAILLRVFAPNGDVIVNDSNNVVLTTELTSGTTTITSGATYQWASLADTSYDNLTGETNTSLTVTPDMVDSVGSFRCAVLYNGKTYYAYWCVTDKSDPVDLTVYSSLGDKLVNGQGIGAIYAIAYRGEEELDPIKTTTFSTTAPANPSSGDFYYQLNKTAKTAVLMKYNGSAWVEATGSDLPRATYSWYRRDALGNVLDTSAYATGKVIYLDNTVVDKKITFRCKFEMK